MPVHATLGTGGWSYELQFAKFPSGEHRRYPDELATPKTWLQFYLAIPCYILCVHPVQPTCVFMCIPSARIHPTPLSPTFNYLSPSFSLSLSFSFLLSFSLLFPLSNRGSLHNLFEWHMCTRYAATKINGFCLPRMNWYNYQCGQMNRTCGLPESYVNHSELS